MMTVPSTEEPDLSEAPAEYADEIRLRALRAEARRYRQAWVRWMAPMLVASGEEKAS
jgi:hypothetical protein